jgi:hypothetical protein
VNIHDPAFCLEDVDNLLRLLLRYARMRFYGGTSRYPPESAVYPGESAVKRTVALGQFESRCTVAHESVRFDKRRRTWNYLWYEAGSDDYAECGINATRSVVG